MGFSVDLVQAPASQALDAVMSVGADEQAELVEAWLAAGNVAAIAEVARIDSAPAPARKSARRALNVLKSRGVPIPSPTRVAAPFSRPQRTVEARFVAPDAAGVCIVSVFSHAVGEGVTIADALISPRGLMEVSQGVVPMGRVKDWSRRLQKERGYAPVVVDVAWARYRVSCALRLNETTGTFVPLEFERAKELLGPAPEQVPEHPLSRWGVSLDWEDPEAVKKSAELHALAEFASYFPPQSAVDDLLQKLGERVQRSGNTEPDPQLFSSWVQEEAHAAADRFFVPELRARIADQLVDAAISVAARAGADQARSVVAVANAVRKAGLVTDAPRDIPFLVAYFLKAVQYLLHAGRGRLMLPVSSKPENATLGE